jgi:hypothetical protein
MPNRKRLVRAPDEPPEDDRGSHPPCVIVFFVEPDQSAEDDVHRITSRLMLLPPRIDETVTIEPGFGSRPVRYTVKEVIHHIPPAHVEGRSYIVQECTCVVVQSMGPRQIDRVVDSLCLAAARRPASDDDDPTTPAAAQAAEAPAR